MCIYKFVFILFFGISVSGSLPGADPEDCHFFYLNYSLSVNDTLKENSALYNGRIWINSYYKIKGDPFFLTPEFIPGSVTFNGRLFRDLKLKYDIYNDEIILQVNPVTVITLNKEMIDSVSLNYPGKTCKVLNIGVDSANVINGLVNVYYDGSTKLFVKFRKMIDPLAVEKRYDLFYQTHRLYVKKDDKIFLVSGKRDLLKLLEDKILEIKAFIKLNKLVVMKQNPESLVPVLRYYDSLKE